MRQLKYLYYQFVRLNATPEEVSRGLALGVFIGMTPTYPFQMLLAVLLAVALKENKVSAMLGTWITPPPPLSIPIYYFNFKVGRFFIPGPENFPKFSSDFSLSDQMKDIANLGFEYLATLLLGCFIVGLFSAILTYWISKPLYIYIRDKRRIILEKRALQKE